MFARFGVVRNDAWVTAGRRDELPGLQIAETERIVLVVDRRLDSPAANGALAAAAAADASFTVIEMRIDRQGAGEGKTSLAAGVAIDTEAKTLALDGYAAAPALLKVTR